MQLRHISPRSTDWMDAMDEGSGGRGWEKLAPEERAKLLRERARASRARSAGRAAWSGRLRSAGRRVAAGYFATCVAFEVGDQDLRGAILRAPRVVRVRRRR